MSTVNPYLNFNGDCETAFAHYREVFGGDYVIFMRFREMPPDDNLPIRDDEQDRVMHVSLPIGEHAVLMGSDTSASMGEVNFGNHISISVDADSEADADRLFAGLADGGQIVMPMEKTFWNAYFGMCTDRFGVQWMVGYDYGEAD